MHQGLVRRALTPGSRETFTERDIELYEDRMQGEVGARVTQAMYRSFLLRELPAIVRGRYAKAYLEVPTLLVAGERDMITRHSDLRGHEGHAADMRIEVLAEAGHFLPEERPAEVAECIRAVATR